MSKAYDQFKHNTHYATNIINTAKNMRAVDEGFAKGFETAMWEAREIFLRLEDEFTIEPIKAVSPEEDTHDTK